MGRTKDLIFEMEAERERKQEALLATPDLIDEANRRILDLRDEVDQNSQSIEELRRRFAASQTWRSRIADHFVSGLIGAAIGAALTAAGLLFRQ